jgi:hypothetical protein
MPNSDFTWAIKNMAQRLFPKGFDVSDNAPNSFVELAAHVASTGRMCVSSTVTPDCEFDADTYYAFRAWHDWCHIHGGHEFTLQGECATVRMQLAMMRIMYGVSRHDEWKPILIRQIIHDNFGQEAFCPAILG